MRVPLIPGRRHGDLYRQEQDAAAAGVAEEPGRRRTTARIRSRSSTRRFPSVESERKPHPMINKRFPLVMMLEPLHACNLTCTGCGRIREYESSIRERLSLEQCLKAVDECGAPMVSICGGEPLLYPEIGATVRRDSERAASTFSSAPTACSWRKKLKDFKPHPGLVFNVHLDGMEKNHDLAVEREGVFKEAIEGIKAAKAARLQGVLQHHGLSKRPT